MKTDLSVKRVTFDSFRNYTTLELTNLSRLVIVVGDNALGKTNIIEGIQLVSMIDSFRNPSWNDLVQKERDCAHVIIEFQLNGCDNQLRLDIRENKRFYQLNEKAKRTRDVCGLLPAVLFTPADLQIIQGPAERRRLCIDDLGCQLSRTFIDIRQDYTRVVKQKNALLREDRVDPDILASWNRNLIKLGSSLMRHRIALFEKVTEKTKRVYHRIAPAEQLTTAYIPSWLLLNDNKDKEKGETVGLEERLKDDAFDGLKDDLKNNSKNNPKDNIVDVFAAMLERYQTQEVRQGRSLIGPHRDEILFFIDGNDARRFGSQGQQRSIALALKIAEVEILQEIVGADPILLLDDVMSEIDEGRRTMLLDLIDTTTQTFITTTNLGYFDDRTLQRAQIIRLPLQEELP